MSLNLHSIVRGAITANLADESFTLYRSVGETFSKGIKTATYTEVTGITGSFQSEGDAALAHAEMAGQNTITRKLYVYATTDLSTRAWSVYRPLARSGDYFKDKNNNYWLVSAVVEDFSDAGWEQLRVTFQQVDPNITIVDTTDENDTETSTDSDSGE